MLYIKYISIKLEKYSGTLNSMDNMDSALLPLYFYINLDIQRWAPSLEDILGLTHLKAGLFWQNWRGWREGKNHSGKIPVKISSHC